MLILLWTAAINFGLRPSRARLGTISDPHFISPLGRVRAGECFGEIAMFMRRPRVADLIVESNARMLRVTSEAFLQLIKELPPIAAPILFAMAQVMAGRISVGNEQYQRAAASEFLWR